MSLFLLVFFILYGAMHAYLLVKVRAIFGLTLPLLIPFAVFMLLMIAGPVITRVLERAGMEGPAFLAAWVTYLWMGFLFLFLSASLVIEIVRFFLYLAGLAAGWDKSLTTGIEKTGFWLALLAALLVAGYGFLEAGHVRIEHLVIRTDKIPKEKGELRIVQISDLHLGLTTCETWLDKMFAEVKRLNPHILVCTGDLLDGRAESLRRSASMFREIAPPYGKFAITGNHEYYGGLPNFSRFADDAGFRVLRGEGISIEGAINVAGVDDIAAIPYHLYKGVEEKSLLSGLEKGRFNLLLKHRPIVDPTAVGLFDLQLSGHTHKGQIFPFNYVVKRFFPYLTGWFDLGKDSRLYVSRGTGSWGPPIRFLSPPEITLIVLEPVARAGQMTGQASRHPAQSP
ncbi:MAG TPA: metallophosphoesterase [Syntrophorhabdaceae bacterium]|jgi:hypothetical protein